jgi:hypothetical protein
MFSHINRRIAHSPLSPNSYVSDNATSHNGSSAWVWVLVLLVSGFVILFSFMFSKELNEADELEQPENRLPPQNHQEQ